MAKIWASFWAAETGPAEAEEVCDANPNDEAPLVSEDQPGVDDVMDKEIVRDEADGHVDAAAVSIREHEQVQHRYFESAGTAPQPRQSATDLYLQLRLLFQSIVRMLMFEGCQRVAIRTPDYPATAVFSPPVSGLLCVDITSAPPIDASQKHLLHYRVDWH